MKRINVYIAAALLVCMQLTACKKDKDSDTGISLVGTWKLISNTNDESYYVFTENKTLYTLSSGEGNRRSVNTSVYKLQGDVLNINGGAILKVEMSGDTLVLSSGPTDVDKYVKDNSKTVEDWVSVVEPEEVMSGLFTPSITFNGSELVVAENSHYLFTKLTFVNPVAKYITKTVACSEQYEGLEYADGKYWGTKDSDKRLYTISPSTGQVLSTSAQAAEQIRAIAGDNTNMYCASYGNTIFKYNFGTALFDAGTSIFNSTIRDMACRNGYLYIVNDSYIYKCNTSSFQVEETYYLKDYFLSAIAFDGAGNAWLMAGEDYLLKVQLN